MRRGRHSKKPRFPLGLAARRAYVAVLLAWLVVTGAWTAFALTSTGPS